MLGGPSLFDAASYFHHQQQPPQPQQPPQQEQEEQFHDTLNEEGANQQPSPANLPQPSGGSSSNSGRRRSRGRGRGRKGGEQQEEGEEEEGYEEEGEEGGEEGGERRQGNRGRNRRGSQQGGGARHGRGRSSISSLPTCAMEATTNLLLPASRIGGVIGRGGDVIKGIRELTGARINISANPGSNDGEEDRDPHYRLVSVSGGVSSVCSAVELIARQAGLFDGLGASESGGGRGRRGRRDSAGGEGDDYSEGGGAGGGGGPLGLRMVIDGNVAGQLIGKKGATINDIRQQSGARIQVLTDEDSLDDGGVDGERVVTVQGEETACRLAHQLICSILAVDPENGAEEGGGGGGGGRRRSSHAGHGRRASAASAVGTGGGGGGGEGEGEEEEGDEESCQVMMRIPNDKIGRVIGKQGETINSIRQETGCRIDIENTRSGEHAMRTVRIKGGLEATQLAQQLITQKIQSEPEV